MHMMHAWNSLLVSRSVAMCPELNGTCGGTGQAEPWIFKVRVGWSSAPRVSKQQVRRAHPAPRPAYRPSPMAPHSPIKCCLVFGKPGEERGGRGLGKPGTTT